MNFAFPALLILLLVLPGVILRYFYFRGAWAESPFTITSFADEVGYGIAFALLLHLLWIRVVSWFGYSVDLHAAFMLLIGTYGSNQGHSAYVIHSVTEHPGRIGAYFLALYLIAAGIGLGAHLLVRQRGWDRATTFLRFHNEWYYLLTGEAASFSEYKDIGEWSGMGGVGAVYLAAVIEQGATPYLYRGIVKGFYFDRNGCLDRIVLILAHRRRLQDDRDPGIDHRPVSDERYYDIAGHVLILRYSEIKTVNLEYIPKNTVSGGIEWLLPPDLFGGQEEPDSGDEAGGPSSEAV
jgi:hypothetical protein